jgi:hypothetical protein
MKKKNRYDALSNEELNIQVAQRINRGSEPMDTLPNWAGNCNDMFNLLGQLEDAVWTVDFAKLDRSVGKTIAEAVARLGVITFLIWCDKVAARDLSISAARMNK